MKILALDTSLDACSVVVLDGDKVLACARKVMKRGHQEHLAPLTRDVMAQARISFRHVQRIGVTVGPGSFTGLRVGLAFAKGLSLTLAIQCVGLGTLEALAAGLAGVVVSAIDAGRGRVYVQAFKDGLAVSEPAAVDLCEVASRIQAIGDLEPLTLVGPGAALIRSAAPDATILALDSPDPIAFARLVARQPTATGSPQLLYLRGPDARTISERAAARSTNSMFNDG